MTNEDEFAIVSNSKYVYTFYNTEIFLDVLMTYADIFCIPVTTTLNISEKLFITAYHNAIMTYFHAMYFHIFLSLVCNLENSACNL